MRGITLSSAMVAVAACASPGVPPGGPVDTEAPQIVRIAPDSGRTGVTPRDVVFRFDEVVSERPSGAQSLTGLFLISPRDGDPRVDWNRNEIAVRPRRGWRRNTAYTITLLPGLSDLRGNTRNTGAVAIFSTGATIPAGRIGGTLFNWVEARVIPRALVEARTLPDTSVVYVTSTDSIGDFTLTNLPAGRYRVRGISDDNNNRGLDPREAWDTVSVDLTDSARVELLAFAHDSLGTRLGTVSVKDSMTLELQFDSPISVTQPLTPVNIRVRASDSTDVPVVSVALPAPDTTAAKPGVRAPAIPSTPPATVPPIAPAPGVTGPVAVVRRPSRPIPARTLVVRLGGPLIPRTEYRVRVIDARNLDGVARSSERVLSAPAPTPPPAPPAVPPAAPPAGSPTPVRR